MYNKTVKTIEIEFRSRFSEKKYRGLERFLNKNAKNLGKDDKDVFFFIMPDKLLKVVNDISKKSAKIVIKLNKIGEGSHFEEIEIPISQKSVSGAVKIFKSLGITHNIMRSFQKRQNYIYKGVELALKHSNAWGYHLELEITVNNLKKKQKAENTIRNVAEELDVKLMTDRELSRFTKKAEADYNKNRSIY